MGSNTNNIVLGIVVITLVSWSAFVASTTAPGMAVVDCTTITALISACSSFVTYGVPDPVPGSPCCIAMTSLNSMADTSDNRRGVCWCLMDLITTYNPNATAIATLPGFCGVYLGFTIDPNTDCE
ncbi:unnamed protein product [Fraxinus pennsylvanica]|uniref:Bifunctional inhibitor/plant lipid transfer protein/seed storage helical domain-containing protein n=1 Tax=Fraxinus pennsylvanica TaxID=56036 RepID=A0AAD1ZI13_9LAMI|nr:unnamed protein product [Fraxinus pennsylvanica]